LPQSEKRTLKDRRRKPTPGLSRYTFFGRRREIRRTPEREKGGYVDRYSHVLFFFLVLVLGLNILDSIFTMMILDMKGWELNPIVQSVMDIHGDKFWIWKFGIVSVSLILLCLHSKFKWVKGTLIAVTAIYLLVVLYQLAILLHS
jgi:Domain of unknown function (DUF5658)